MCGFAARIPCLINDSNRYSARNEPQKSNLDGRTNMRFVSKVPAFVIMILLTMGTVHAIGQVTAAARGGGNQANAFGMFTFNNPDYGNAYTYGGTFGADYRLGNYHFGQPAIAARVSFVPGGLVGENTYMIGPEFHLRGRHLRPYADFHIGFGTISYQKGKTEENYNPPPPYPTLLHPISSRSGLAYEFGGGLDYRLKRNFGLRVVDFQYQSWSVGKGDVFRSGKPPTISGNITYTPFQISTGLYYRFH